MPLLDVRRLASGLTEYRVTSDANKYGFMACVVLFAHSIITSWVAALISAYCWAFATRYESVTVIKALALQLQCTLRCGLSSISCYDIEQVQDALIWEHVSTTDVKFYLAFKVAGQEDLVVAYKSLLPRLAVIQPVYKEIVQELTCQQGLCGQRKAAEHSTADET